MKMKRIVTIIFALVVLIGPGGYSTPVYADNVTPRPFELPISFKPPENQGVVEVSTNVQLTYISWYQELYKDKYIKLMNSIEMSIIPLFPLPWIPIDGFQGTFDGNGYDINNLSIIQPVKDASETWGMFKETQGIIKNVTLTNFTVIGKAKQMGTLAGLNKGEIKNVGIIGGKIEQTINYQVDVITLGGLVGNNWGSVENVYSTCKVSSFNTAMYDDASIASLIAREGVVFSVISRTYAAGAVFANYSDDSNLFVSGLKGDGKTGSYYDRQTVGLVESSIGALSTEEMLNQSSFVGWDFQNTWSILPGKTYPFLKKIHTVTPSILPPASQNSSYSQKLEIPASASAPADLVWEATSLPPGLTLSSDGTLNGTPTSLGDQNFTAVAYSPSTHIVYASGSVSLNITPAILPVTTVAATPAAPNGANGWYSTDITVSLHADNSGSGWGIDKTMYRVNGGAWNPYSVPFALTNDGTFNVEYYSSDKAGNIEPVKSVNLKLDKTAPVTQSSIAPIRAVSPTGGTYISGYTVTLTATDNLSTVTSTVYRTNGSTWEPYTAPFTINAATTQTVEYFSTDGAGNKEPIRLMGHSPVVVAVPSDLTLTAGGATVTRDVYAYFTDPDGDALTVAASSSDASIAAASLGTDGTLTISPIAAGTATIILSANDGRGGLAETSFAVHVESRRNTQHNEPSPPATITTPPVTVTDHKVNVVPKSATDGSLTASLTGDELKQALLQTVDHQLNIVIQTNTEAQSRKITLDLPVAGIVQGSGEVRTILVDTGAVSVSISTDPKDGIFQPNSQHLTLSISPVTVKSLPPSVQAMARQHPAYDLSLNVDGKQIQALDAKRNPVTVAMKVELQPGEKPHQIVVYYIDDNGNANVVRHSRFDNQIGLITFKPPRIGRYAVVFANSSFEDLSTVPWAKTAIESLAAREVVNGVGGGLFDPARKVTRAEFVQMLATAMNLPEDGQTVPFTDVDRSAWYAHAVAAAYQNGIVKGIGGSSFAPGVFITREQAAVMIYKALNQSEVQPGYLGHENRFTDDSSIAGYAREAVAILQKMGLIEGSEDHTFRPKQELTRAEAAVIFNRFISL